MVRDKAFWIFISLLGIITTFCITISIIYHNQIQFDPVKAINDGIAFIIGLLAMIISFWIAEIYWKRKIEQEQSKKDREQLNYYLNNIAKIVFETSKALAEVYGESENEKAIRRDKEVLANLRRLGDAKQNILRVMDISGFEFKQDKRSTLAITSFRSNVISSLEDLSQRACIRPGVENIETELAVIGGETDKTIKILNGVLSDY